MTLPALPPYVRLEDLDPTNDEAQLEQDIIDSEWRGDVEREDL